MAIRKTIEIDGVPVTFQASAATPRLYRNMFGRDIIADMDHLVTALEGQQEGASGLDTFTLELFENAAFTMAKQATPGIPDDVIVWLDSFEVFSIYQILPHILELWNLNIETLVEAKKKALQPTES
ncbi:MAG: hypothetical protein IKE76_05080 [Clostridia bacterium]|nr:hypothetical protein [Clostridia bacterium]